MLMRILEKYLKVGIHLPQTFLNMHQIVAPGIFLNQCCLCDVLISMFFSGTILETLKTSDSDFSDSENARFSKLKHAKAKVRQAALSFFYSVIKVLFHTSSNF